LQVWPWGARPSWSGQCGRAPRQVNPDMLASGHERRQAAYFVKRALDCAKPEERQMPSRPETAPSCPNKKPNARSGVMFGVGLLLCAVCCSAPLLAGIGIGGAALAAFGTYAELLGLALVGLGALGFVLSAIGRRRSLARANSCALDCACRMNAKTSGAHTP
jgi:hypothetical protein